MKKAIIQLEELTCPSLINKIENALPKLNGVISVNVKYHTNKVEVSFNESIISTCEIEGVINDLGFKTLEAV